MTEKMDKLYKDYQTKLRVLEEEQDEITKVLRKIETEEEDFRSVKEKIKELTRMLPHQWKSDYFFREIDHFADDTYEAGRIIEEEMTDKKEELQEQRKRLYNQEVEYHEEFQRNKLYLNEQEGEGSWD